MPEPASAGMRRIASRLGIDRAVAFTVAGRVLTLGGGLLAAAFVVRYLTRVEQGFHYTFLSLLTAQVFFELGFAYTTMQLAAHEKARLAWQPDGTMAGDATALRRLAALQVLTLRWSTVVAAVFVAGLAPAGLWFFGHADVPGVAWRAPWVWLVSATAVTLGTAPLLALLEGCGLVARVALVRSVATLASQSTLCVALALGAGLRAAPMAATAAAAVPLGWLLLSARPALLALAASHTTGSLSWRQEVWPLQWRLGLSWLSGFFIYYAFNPILFQVAGPVEAGRFGLALSVTGTISTVGLAWISTRVPTFSGLIAERRFAEVDRLFARSLRQALAFAGVLALGLVGGLVLVTVVHHPISARIVGPGAFLALVAAALANLVASSEAAYLRAYKQDPFLGISLLTAVLVTGGAVAAARWFGTTGVALAYLAVMSTVMLGGGHVIFLRKRAQWQVPRP
jgi:hypothetical protein